MHTLKTIGISFAVTALSVAVISRVGFLRKLVLNVAA